MATLQAVSPTSGTARTGSEDTIRKCLDPSASTAGNAACCLANSLTALVVGLQYSSFNDLAPIPRRQGLPRSSPIAATPMLATSFCQVWQSRHLIYRTFAAERELCAFNILRCRPRCPTGKRISVLLIFWSKCLYSIIHQVFFFTRIAISGTWNLRCHSSKACTLDVRENQRALEGRPIEMKTWSAEARKLSMDQAMHGREGQAE